MSFILIDIALLLLKILSWIILGNVILGWLVAFNVINTSQPQARAFVLALDRLVAPIYRPIRKILPDFGGIDFSPLVVLLVIQVLRKVLVDIQVQSMITA